MLLAKDPTESEGCRLTPLIFDSLIASIPSRKTRQIWVEEPLPQYHLGRYTNGATALVGVQLSARDQQDRDGPPQQSSNICSAEAHRCRNDSGRIILRLDLKIRPDGSEDDLPSLLGLLGSWKTAEAEGRVEIDAMSWLRWSMMRSLPFDGSSGDDVRHGVKNAVACASDD